MQKIQYAGKADLEKVAKCHQNAFPYALSSRMGLLYLTKMFDWYLSTDKTFLLHLTFGEETVGYCGGLVVDGTLKTGSASGMLQHSFREGMFTVIGRPWLLFHPEMLKKYRLIARNILMKLKIKRPSGLAEDPSNSSIVPHVGLVVIGVDPRFQGKGIGALLLEKFQNHAQVIGIQKLQLTVNHNNEKAIKAYIRNGWQLGEVHENSIKMTKNI